MKPFLYTVAFVCALIASIVFVATYTDQIPNSGYMGVGVCLFGMYGSIESLKELS